MYLNGHAIPHKNSDFHYCVRPGAGIIFALSKKFKDSTIIHHKTKPSLCSALMK